MFNISEKMFKKITAIQKVLLIISAVASVAFDIRFVLTVRRVDDVVIANLAYAAALICGFIYATKDYSKQANKYYKAMLFLYALSVIFPIVSLVRSSGFSLALLDCVARFVLLLILSFGKDLGEKNTWIIFYTYLALEILSAPLSIMAGNRSLSSPLALCGYIVVRLIDAGILGLCIIAKYRDKKTRGAQ